MIQTKRVYDSASPRDGKRFLVERLWPRGMSKSSLRFDAWLKEVAPSDALRRWFAHDPAKWLQFKQRYAAELTSRRDALEPLVAAALKGTVTLLYSARDVEHNSAVVLKAYLEKRVTNRRSKAQSSTRTAVARRRAGRSRR
ncbi:MAG: DUF488 domain-containing protein [Chloroflexi bacterium]|nr:DUF488 domain-containing protein [Chloroflexota bacterium]